MGVITVRFIATSGFVGRGIRFCTNSLFQHVEFGTPEGTWIGAHAGAGVEERPANYCVTTRDYTYDVPCTDDQQYRLLLWACGKIGTKYNLLDIAGLMLHARRLTAPHRVICSQFCTEGLLTVFGSARALNVLPEFAYLVTPEMLHLSPLFVGRRRKASDAA